MEGDAYRITVGIDWASASHQVCAIGRDGQTLAERTVDHSGEGLVELGEWLTELVGDEPAASLAVAIETPRGPIIASLLARGFHVYSINPKQLDRFRDRHTVAGAKDDRLDALVLADSLRTDRPKFKRLGPEDPLVVELRALVAVDGELRDGIIRVTNRLREQLGRFHIQILKVASNPLDRPWVWDLIKLVPIPQRAWKIRASSIDKLLKKHRVRKVSAREVLKILRETPLPVGPGETEAASSHVSFLLPQLRLQHQQRSDCQRRIAEIVEAIKLSSPDDEGEKREHRDVQILKSLPGVGNLVAATMLAEAYEPLARRDYHALRTHAGVAPVTRRSGKRQVVSMRRACNNALREALFHMARVNIQHDARSRALYDAQRAAGASQGRALRAVADRLLCVLVAMLRTQTPYDPHRRSADVA